MAASEQRLGVLRKLSAASTLNIADLAVGEVARVDPPGIREALLLCPARHAGDPLRAIAASRYCSPKSRRPRRPAQTTTWSQRLDLVTARTAASSYDGSATGECQALGSSILLDLTGGVALLLWGLHMVHSGIVRAFGSNLRRFLGRALRS